MKKKHKKSNNIQLPSLSQAFQYLSSKILWLLHFSNAFLQKKRIDTGSVDNEKQESVDNSPGHLKIGKDCEIFANFQMTR